MLDFDTFLQMWATSLYSVVKYEDWRPGQYFFNLLYHERPDISDQIRATAFDPFYGDGRLPAAFKKVEELW